MTELQASTLPFNGNNDFTFRVFQRILNLNFSLVKQASLAKKRFRKTFITRGIRQANSECLFFFDQHHRVLLNHLYHH